MYAFIVILLAVLAVFFFLNYSDFGGYISKLFSILSPVLLGVLFAYLLNPIVRFFENKVFGFIVRKGGKRGHSRALAVTCTYLALLLAITGFVALIVPQIVSGYTDLLSNMNNYIRTIQNWLTGLAEKNELLSEFTEKIFVYLNDVIGRISEIVQQLIPSITKIISNVITVVKNSFIGIIMSVYFLLAKERLGAQSKKIARACMSEKKYESFMKNVAMADKSFGGFISAKILDSFIIGVICFISMALLGMPYYPLISLIVGVTNVIPFFGPFIGAIPGAFIIFIISPVKALWFCVLIFFIQQLDGNYIGPKLIGSSIGLEPVWIIVSITVMSGLLGFTGMVFGVPIFAVIYAFVKNGVENRLKNKGLPSETTAYYTNEAGKQLCAERAARAEKKSRGFFETKLGKKIHDFAANTKFGKKIHDFAANTKLGKKISAKKAAKKSIAEKSDITDESEGTLPENDENTAHAETVNETEAAAMASVTSDDAENI